MFRGSATHIDDNAGSQLVGILLDAENVRASCDALPLLPPPRSSLKKSVTQHATVTMWQLLEGLEKMGPSSAGETITGDSLRSN